MKSLYDKDARCSKKANDLGHATHESVKTIFNTYINLGYSPREISHIMINEIIDLELSATLRLE